MSRLSVDMLVLTESGFTWGESIQKKDTITPIPLGVKVLTVPRSVGSQMRAKQGLINGNSKDGSILSKTYALAPRMEHSMMGLFGRTIADALTEEEHDRRTGSDKS